MLDIKFVRDNPDAVRENIKKKFQDRKLPLVDEVLELDAKNRAAITEASELRASRNALSKQIGQLMAEIANVPEPATASLSLLGLAALMMRRRRA